ncbi:MAG: chorismate synthase [Nitrososphaerota archaeon]|nr:chorismate synthase [Nitrososphaerota archaeon]
MLSDNAFGGSLVLVSFGESHGPYVGVLIEGLPAGTPINETEIYEWLRRRKPGTSVLSSARQEEEKVEFIAGVYRGVATGAPLVAVVKNTGGKDEFYEFMENGWVRPGHADYPAYIKYNGKNDYRGGGRFSARITVGFVIAGAIAASMIRNLGIEIAAYTRRIGNVECRQLDFDEASQRYRFETRCPVEEYDAEMKKEILAARRDGDSVGGVIEVIARGMPVGIGQPVFSSLDSELAKAFFSIPAVKGVEFGAGFMASQLRGSQNNDQFRISGGKISTATNNAGGVLGGMSSGAPLVARIAFKPVSSIYKVQKTVNVKTMQEGELQLKGMHDPCVVPRAVPIVEAVTAFTVADLAMRGGFIK